jgi:hypothetical protein
MPSEVSTDQIEVFAENRGFGPNFEASNVHASGVPT